MQHKTGFGVEGVWGVISTVNMIERKAQKLRRIILFRFGLIAFLVYLGKARKTLHVQGFRTWRT